MSALDRLLFLPPPAPSWTPSPLFFSFAFFDISKLPPVNLLERLPAEWGVMMDDVMAGIYGVAALLIASAYGTLVSWHNH